MRSTPAPKQPPKPSKSPPAPSSQTGAARSFAAARWLDRIATRLREWDTLPLAVHFRRVSLLAVFSTVAMAAVLIALSALVASRSAIFDRVDELAAQVERSLSTSIVRGDLLDTLVVSPAILAARIESGTGSVLSEYVAADFDAVTPGHEPSLLRRLAQSLWLAPFDVHRPAGSDSTRTLIVTVDNGLLWSGLALELAIMLPLLVLSGWLIARQTERLMRRVSRRVTDPLIGLAVATRGGQWKSSDQQAGAVAPVDPIAEVIDNFEAMRERLGEYERQTVQVRRHAEVEVARRTAELEQRALAAERASAGMGDFLANMSHEIRTPMNGVVGMAELLSRTDLDERQQRFLRSMRAASDSMVKIINDILDVTKMDSGNMEVVPEPCVLRDLVEDVGQLYAARAQTKGLELVCYIEPGVPAVVSADVLRLRQVLGNLVSNAVKYTERGEIVLRASPGETSDGRSIVYFEISDTGPGIPQDQQAMIFEPYKQLANTSQQAGTGLGLPIALRLVKLMGGAGIDLHSTPGHGSRFVFWLPCEVIEASRQTRSPTTLKDMRVLVVDDNSTSYLFLEDTIASWGAEVTVISHGRLLRDRLRTAQQERAPFDAVVLDHSLPDVTLADMLAVIRLDPQFRDTHVVLLSALEFEADPAADASIVPDICIAKPVRQQALADALELARIPREAQGARRRSMNTDAGQKESLPGFEGLNVLVVDDNAINREVAVAMLEARGCSVTLAEEGSRAVALASATGFDLILMDCQMPGLDGYAATESIRREEHDEGRPRTLIVALTANVLPRDRERCHAAGMDEILLKPFSGEQLDAVLRQATEHVSGRPRAQVTPAPAATDAPFTQTLAGGLAPEFDLFTASEPVADFDADEPVLDLEQIAAILALRKPQLLEQLCTLLRQRAPEALRAIQQSLAEGDLPRVRTAAHELRSPAGTLGGRRFAALLGRCEDAAAEHRLDDAMFFGRHLAAAYHALNQALDAELARHATQKTGT
jgi:two-component system sensor histidine kinase/response regulator